MKLIKSYISSYVQIEDIKFLIIMLRNTGRLVMTVMVAPIKVERIVFIIRVHKMKQQTWIKMALEYTKRLDDDFGISLLFSEKVVYKPAEFLWVINAFNSNCSPLYMKYWTKVVITHHGESMKYQELDKYKIYQKLVHKINLFSYSSHDDVIKRKHFRVTGPL